MKKALIIFLTVFVVAATLAGCSGSGNDTSVQSSDGTAESKTESTVNSTAASEGTDTKYKCTNHLNTEKDDKYVDFYINTPYFKLIEEGGTGLYGDLGNGTKVFVASVNPYIYDDDSFDENKFPADFGEMKELVENFRGDSSADDMEFSIEKAKKVSHAGYDMIRYTGTHTYRYFGAEDYETSPEMKYFAYVMRLKGNNAVVSWLVLDDVTNTASHTATSLAEAEKIADKMAETVREK